MSGDLSIRDNTALTSLHGLESLRTVDRLQIRRNPRLQNLEGLVSLQQVRSVQLYRLRALWDLRGLSQLAALDDLTITDTGIGSTRGLESLRSVANLRVAGNRRLIDLCGLDGLLRADRVTVRNNRLLFGGSGEFLGGLRINNSLVVGGNPGVFDRDVARIRAQLKPARAEAAAAGR